MESTELPVMSASPHQLKDVEDLATELKRLLVSHERTLDEEGIRHEVEVLERWMESYRRGLAAASKISENGTEWLAHLRDHLKLAADELQRLEGEGGTPPSREQLERMDELHKAVKRIDNVLPEFEQMFRIPAEQV
jgi:hypothetical protein